MMKATRKALIGALAVVLAAVAAISGAGAIGDDNPNADIHQFGSAVHHGDTSAFSPASRVVDMVATSTGNGYWQVSEDGGIFAFGDAVFHGSLGDLVLNQPIVAMAATPSGDGYWLAASDGGIFAFGDAGFHGSMGGTPLNEPIVGMAPTPTGDGYWLAASDGGIFAFGDAVFHGSMGAVRLNQPVVGMAVDPDSGGYWMVARDGGIFSFGGAAFHGSTGDIVLNQPVLGMAPHPSGGGYWMVARDGGVFAFGASQFHGSAAPWVRHEEVTAIAAHPDGDGYWLARAAGPVWPLTGVPTPSVVDRPALAVKIDNHFFSRGQWGLNQADIVVEELVEGSLTRFVAVFHSQAPPIVGPVRSARETDVAILPVLGESLLVYSGGNQTVRNIVEAAPSITPVNPVPPYNDLFYRTSRRPSPHDLLTGAPELWSATAGLDLPIPTAMFSYRAEIVTDPQITVAPSMFLDFGGQTATWDWNGTHFVRSHGTRAHVDATGVQVHTDNVVVLETPYFTSGSTGSPVADVTGSGRGFVLNDGHMIEVTWSRPSESSAYTLTSTADSSTVGLKPGRTFVALVPTGLSPFN